MNVSPYDMINPADIVFAAFAVGGGIACLIGAVFHVFMALGLYPMAQRRGVSKPWFAWVPLLNVWLLGALADNYTSRIERKNTFYRIILTVLSLLVECFALFFLLQMGQFLNVLLGSLDYSVYSPDVGFSQVASMTGFSSLTSLAAIACAVFQYIALHKIYRSCDPRNAATFTVLTVLFGIQSFLLFAVRKKDYGLCPPQYYWQPPYGQPPYGQPPYGQPPYGQPPQYGQPQNPGWQNPQGWQPPQNPQNYQNPQSFQNPQNPQQ